MYPLRDDAKTLVRELGLTNPFDYFRRFLDGLVTSGRYAVRQIRDLTAGDSGDRVIVGLRHDMDTEPYSSVVVARALSECGLTGSFYVLHTADYYGQWVDDVFRRTDEITQYIVQTTDSFGRHYSESIDAEVTKARAEDLLTLLDASPFLRDLDQFRDYAYGRESTLFSEFVSRFRDYWVPHMRTAFRKSLEARPKRTFGIVVQMVLD